MDINPPLSDQPQDNQHPSLRFLSSGDIKQFGHVLEDEEPDTFRIEGETWRARHIIGEGRDLTEKEDRVARKYLTMRSLLHDGRVFCCCERKDELPVDEESGFPSGDIHHFKRTEDGKRLHQLREMAFANHQHNSRVGKPPVVRRSGLTQRERASPAYTSPAGFQPSSRELAMSIEMFPKTVAYLFHPLTGRVRNIEDQVEKDWLVNNLPDIVGLGRSTTFGKYVHELVKQEYLKEMAKGSEVYLVRTGKKVDKLLERTLGIATADRQPLPPEPPTR